MSAMILVALGANLPSSAGIPALTLRATLKELEQNSTSLLAVSKFYVTPAWPDPRDPAFVNAVAKIETTLSPRELLDHLHDIERQFGRVRGEPNHPRTLDLDIVDYNGRIEMGPPRLPHPRIEQRGFVLIPLADVAPGWRHPKTGVSVEDLIARLPPEGRDVKFLAE